MILIKFDLQWPAANVLLLPNYEIYSEFHAVNKNLNRVYGHIHTVWVTGSGLEWEVT